MKADTAIPRVCPVQVDPLKFFGLLRWIDGRPLLEVMEPYRQKIHSEFLYTFRADGSPRYKRGLKGRGKKNSKTADEVFEGLYKLLAWKPAGQKGNQCYFVASDLGQANDDLDLCKKLIRCNPILDAELFIKQNIIERKDGKGFIEILPAGDAPGLHGKTYLFFVVDELHTQRDYRVLEALELDRTRPDAVQSFASYASMSCAVGIPINDILKQHAAQSDPRLFVSWYSGTIEEANPSLNGPLGPTMEDIEDAQRSLPSWIFRRLYLNLPGQPDGAAFDAGNIESSIVKGRTVLPPEPDRHYVAFCDLSGGGADDATLAVAHTHEGVGVLDLVIDQGARTNRTFSPDETVAKFSEVVKQYGISSVTGDRYAAQWPVLAFEKHGITYRPAALNRSQIYAALEPLLNSGQVELLDQPKLLAQLIGLVRKGEKIDHTSGEHDDHSNAAAGALVLVQAASAPLMFFSGGRMIGAAPRPVPLMETEEDDSLVEKIGTAVSSAVEAVTGAVGAAATAITRTLTTPAPRPRPIPDAPTRSIREIEGLSEGSRSPEEQEQLDRHYDKQRRRRARSGFEEMVRAHRYWFPGDAGMAPPSSDLSDTMEAIRHHFAQWR